jgi:xanthine dehydrogenase molybdopterin-binding subunit B
MSNDKSIKRIFDIGGYRVVFARGDGWQCTCELWREEKGCPHVRLAAALVTLGSAVIALGGSISRH